MFVASLGLFPLLGLSFFPRTDAGQFVINLKAPTGTRLAVTEGEVAKVEGADPRSRRRREDLGMIVSNIGATPDFSAIYTTNSAMHTAFVQVSLKEDHKTGSYEYMARVKQRIADRDAGADAPTSQSGGLVDAVLNMGLPAPIDVQVAGTNMENALRHRADSSPRRSASIAGVADVFIPQDIDYPALQLDIDRTRAAELGLDQREVVGQRHHGADLQPDDRAQLLDRSEERQRLHADRAVSRKPGADASAICAPFRCAAPSSPQPTRLDMISDIRPRQRRPPKSTTTSCAARSISMCGRSSEDLGRIANCDRRIIAETKVPEGLTVTLRGMVQGMRASFTSFALGLCLAVVLLYLILVAQFQSFIDPFIILLAVPPGLTGVILTLWLTDTTLNVMSLMGVVMLVGIAVSNSILIVEFTRHLRERRHGRARGGRDGVPRALAAGADDLARHDHRAAADGAEAGRGQRSYAPLARAILGGSRSRLC